MHSKAAIAGHPLHPALVVAPIGLFIWALVADIVYIAQDHDQMWYDISFWSSIAAVATALVAAIPGFVDGLTVALRSDAKNVMLAHMVLNLSVVALYVVAIVLMLDNGATDGGRLGAVVALHAVGTGLLALSGWLGGEMVFRHHLGMVADSAELERDEEVRHEFRPGQAPRPGMNPRR